VLAPVDMKQVTEVAHMHTYILFTTEHHLVLAPVDMKQVTEVAHMQTYILFTT